MFNKKLLLGFCVLGLSGCVTTSGGQPGPNTPPAVDHSFSSTRNYLMSSGICPHPQDSDPYRRNAPKEVRCLGGTWDSVALMASGRDAMGNDLDKMRLLWRNWKPGMHLGNDKEAAAQFVAVLAERYISPKNRVAFAADFLDGKNGRFRSGDFEVSLNAKDQGRYVLHRIELKNLAEVGTNHAQTWVPPSPPKGDYIAPMPVMAPPQGWVNPNPAVEPTEVVPPKMPQLVIPQPAPEPAPQPVVSAPVEEVVKPVPPLVPPRDEIMAVPVPRPKVEVPQAVPVEPHKVAPLPVPLPVVPAPQPIAAPEPDGEIIDPIVPQAVVPIQPPMERQKPSPAELIPNFPMDEEENYIFKEFDGEIGNDL